MGVKDSFLGKMLGNADKFSEEQVAQTITLLVEHGVKHGASDIHIEPHERFVQVRYRIDNVLRSAHKLPLAALPAVVSQIKELAHIQEHEGQLPQEGQYATLVGEEQFEIQAHTMPVISGEKAVLHISRRLNKPPSLAALGFWGQSLEMLQQLLARTHGLIIVAMPRRNGKTTTLHSMLQLINTPAVSIATVERVIEYRLPGASQTQIRPGQGISYFDGLQAALNQDPNVIMVSDVADKQTTNLVIHGAASGHLVLAGMHADSAVAALVRMQALAEERFLLSHTVRAAVSQRLVRKLCAHCKVAYTLTRTEAAHIEKTFGITSAAAKKQLHALDSQAATAGIGGKTLSTNPSGISTMWQVSDDGCEACNHTGYQGSLAIVEVLGIENNEVETALLAPVQADRLRQLALKEGFVPMELDGLIKALRGQTTIAEVLRTLAL